MDDIQLPIQNDLQSLSNEGVRQIRLQAVQGALQQKADSFADYSAAEIRFWYRKWQWKVRRLLPTDSPSTDAGENEIAAVETQLQAVAETLGINSNGNAERASATSTPTTRMASVPRDVKVLKFSTSSDPGRIHVRQGAEAKWNDARQRHGMAAFILALGTVMTLWPRPRKIWLRWSPL